jgi:hypothetical protein
VQVLDHGLRADHQAVRDLGDKTGFLAEQFDDPAPVSVAEDIEEP